MSTTTREQINPLQRVSNGLSDLCYRWVPDPWIIVVLLTGVAAVLSFFLTPGGLGLAKAQTIVEGWGGGFWGLLEFAMQMAFILMSGYVVASSPPVRRALIWVADRQKGAKRTVATVALTSMILTWIHWGIGLVAAGILVRYLAARNTQADYRLLVAVAYLGMSGTFHAGLSSSAGLLVATPGHFAEDYFGLIPTSETIFSTFNLALVAITILVWTLTATLLHPSASETVRPPLAVQEALALEGETTQGPASAAADQRPGETVRKPSPVHIIENSPWINGTIGVAGLAYVLVYFGGLEGNILNGLTLNSVNFIFLFVGILLHRTPRSLLTAAEKGGSFAWGIILQFPFYAGILGMIVATGLSSRIANAFSAIANEHTYPLFVYWYSAMLNFLVPSGGSKFAVEAPYLAEASQTLNVPLDLTVVAYMWGDMATNAVQPFWALPLLAMCGLGFRDIMGFLVVFALVILTVGSTAFLIAPLVF